MPEGFISSESVEGKIQKSIDEWKKQQLTKIILAENATVFEQQYGLLINGLRSKGIEQLNKKKQEGYLQNCEEYGKQNHKINQQKGEMAE